MVTYASCDYGIIGDPPQFIAELYLTAAQLRQPGKDTHRVAKAGGCPISDLDTGDGKMVAAGSDLGIGHTGSAHPGHAAHFKPDNVGGMMHHAHEISFGKTNGDVNRGHCVRQIDPGWSG